MSEKKNSFPKPTPFTLPNLPLVYGVASGCLILFDWTFFFCGGGSRSGAKVSGANGGIGASFHANSDGEPRLEVSLWRARPAFKRVFVAFVGFYWCGMHEPRGRLCGPAQRGIHQTHSKRATRRYIHRPFILFQTFSSSSSSSSSFSSSSSSSSS